MNQTSEHELHELNELNELWNISNHCRPKLWRNLKTATSVLQYAVGEATAYLIVTTAHIGKMATITSLVNIPTARHVQNMN